MKNIKITSGDYAGRFVGPNIAGGLTTNADLFVVKCIIAESFRYSAVSFIFWKSRVTDCALLNPSRPIVP